MLQSPTQLSFSVFYGFFIIIIRTITKPLGGIIVEVNIIFCIIFFWPYSYMVLFQGKGKSQKPVEGFGLWPRDVLPSFPLMKKNTKIYRNSLKHKQKPKQSKKIPNYPLPPIKKLWWKFWIFFFYCLQKKPIYLVLLYKENVLQPDLSSPPLLRILGRHSGHSGHSGQAKEEEEDWNSCV